MKPGHVAISNIGGGKIERSLSQFTRLNVSMFWIPILACCMCDQRYNAKTAAEEQVTNGVPHSVDEHKNTNPDLICFHFVCKTDQLIIVCFQANLESHPSNDCML